ncbi:Fanconi anemia group M protein isoform X2 [Dunckerocampus dactyliophorus]|uniref:Fanconi anemia group M protein isoform X2 n=1 Tax=Dunckerocampus dactyliophorus TaxID=161453 RepID=UPI002406E8E7|nr:Fanconi anemia group M protein isoform X2 [Dunckerocampus dactyliophorus]
MSTSSNQRTLFQTWGKSVPQNKVAPPRKEGKKAAGQRRTTPSITVKKTTTNPLWTEIGNCSSSTVEAPEAAHEDDDDLMLVAVTEAEQSLQLDNANLFQNAWPISPMSSSEKTCYPDFPGFDGSSAAVWIYPTNYPIREYQLKISEAALFQNTLVCLPTGLGKTFIASVVMYNFYRWYPSGKIVFMAPTKPLVSQQIEACYKVMGIPQAHMAELTGSTAANKRQEVWRSKRVFFLTPQVMMNDLSRDTCPARQVKCVVIDEAHKALGNHAYCQVIRQLSSQTLQFRILALSATPGGDTKSVQSVISNLLISHIELRSEESPDIQAHSHQRSVEKMVVPLGEALAAHQARYLQVLEKFMSRLVSNRAMGHKDLKSLTKYQLILARDQFRKNPPPNIKGPQQGMLEGDFALCISLYHGYELLMQMGLRSLFFYIQGIMDGSREMSRTKNELQRTPVFMDLYSEMEAKFVKLPGSPAQQVSTRVMIFSSFRDSVQEIAAMLNRHAPLIRVMTFMGQASAGKGVKGFTQKEQLEVVNRFRQGGFNTLVSTCVGEEGLDIGEVDLIVCFDAQKNPIRLVQRMGRTGRKRQGRIVVILAEGREERTYNQSQSNKRSVLKSIVGNKSGFHMYPNSPRMLPDGVNPTLHKMHITCGQFDHRESRRRSVRGRRSHIEGRASLIHPYNLNCEEGAASGAFLSSTEYSLWASSMRLAEDEAQPTLRQSHFVSLPCDGPAQEDVSRSGVPVRELSLWEWRHWQHRVLPTHVIDHSLRCQHFIKVMELIDGMREENEEDCAYEKELLPYLSEAGDGGHLKRIKKRANIFTETVDESVSCVERCNEEGLTSLSDKLKPHDHSVACSPQTIINEPIIENLAVNSNNIPPVIDQEPEEDVEFQAMFYLPKWDLPSKYPVIPGRGESLQVILANVAELLSRSPPPLADFDAIMADWTAPFLPDPNQPFHVSFTLDVDDDDDDDDDSDCEADVSQADKDQPYQEPVNRDSPTWDEVFEDEVTNENEGIMHGQKDRTEHVGEAPIHEDSVEKDEPSCWDDVMEKDLTDACVKAKQDSAFCAQMDDSMDLFGDDEAFLQMTIPDISTPEGGATPRTSPSVEDIANSTKKMLTHLETCDARVEQRPLTTTDSSTTNPRRSVESFDSLDFAVNFDLGYSLEDSEEEDDTVVTPLNTTLQQPQKQEAANSSTPCSGFHRPAVASCSTYFPTLQMLSGQRERDKSMLLMSPMTSKTGTSLSPMALPGSALGGPRAFRLSLSSLKRTRSGDGAKGSQRVTVSHSDLHPAECNTDSDDEAIIQKRKHMNKVNPLSSPEASKVLSDVNSPPVCRKRATALNTSEETEGDSDDFQTERVVTHRRVIDTKRNKCQKVRQFLDEEAALSDEEEGVDVSSDEEDGEDQNQSLDGFVVDNTHLSQGLNDSEMHGIYLKSVRSPAVTGRLKMSYRKHDNTDIFSQVPELDETYAEDSFVVGSEAEESSEEQAEEEVVELMPEDSYVDGRRQYATRRRVFLHKARATSSAPARGGKRGRVLRLADSSEEEGEDVSAPPQTVVKLQPEQKSSSSIASKVSLLRGEERDERCRQRIENQHLLSDQLDFDASSESHVQVESSKLQETPSTTSDVAASSVSECPVCILVDSRCISGGVELVTSLRRGHGATVRVCSLDGSYFIVSGRMAVERHSQSDLASTHNRKRLAERVNGMQELFERVCLIVEKDRTRPGDTSRPFQRTRHYDSTLAALVRTGVRLLWSDGAEQSAALLVELAQLERRKGQGIVAPPADIKGQHSQQALQLYLSLPAVNYVHALNMSRNFSSVAQLINSSVESIEKGGGMSRARAEEIYRFLRYDCDSFLVDKVGKAC